ncbi:TNFAIP3-interacting protein 3 [Latimeria chalumnae]|uniref:TNFAIP3-interacting protein 3 n=1 Tax=Latimeria chalumnae TaxID=7897 RepID=UPI0003C11445|nr:PREDICTED: TNFAIP3-interacting protein 3-like [Latimeria chalumnae]|eukprot:XP_005992953.1 PREDICTED: TNFAIP3-interacting protein 3-like [Latimeria chalumnae]
MDSRPLLPPNSTTRTEFTPDLEKTQKRCPEDCEQITAARDLFPLTRVNAVGGESEREMANESEENITFISESMTVTSADEEKVLLLNKNTDLRRLNKELVKLNQEWDQIYHTTTMGLQQKVGSLQQEVLDLKQQGDRLSRKLEHEQNKREYYEQTLLQELKKNQHLQEYVRHLEAKLYSNGEREVSQTVTVPKRSEMWKPGLIKEPAASSSTPNYVAVSKKNRDQTDFPDLNKHKLRIDLGTKGSEKEVKELKDQLEALKCQTKIYEADYKTEHKDRERIKAENEKLRKKTEDMRQQMLLLQEQLKIYEDDFRKERSDKQVLQRLLKSKSNPKDPILVHRCNNDHEGLATAAVPTSSSHRRSTYNKHCERHRVQECSKHPRHKDAEVQASPYSIDCHKIP